MTEEEFTLGDRKAARDSLLFNVELTVEGMRKPVTMRVRNLSPRGMMIDGDATLPERARVTTDLRGVGEVEGFVAWTQPGRAGIAFDVDIDPHAARTIAAPPGPRPQIYKRSQDYSRRPGLRSGQ